jgi:hypothetical protein
MKQLQPWWFTPDYQIKGKPEVKFHLRPLDQRTNYIVSSDIGRKGVGVDGAFAAFEYSVIGWEGFPEPYSPEAKRQKLTGQGDASMSMWIFQVAGELYKQSFLEDDALKNSESPSTSA